MAQGVDRSSDFLTRLKLGPLSNLSPGAQYRVASDEFESAASQARDADPDALARFEAVAEQFLDRSRSIYASSGQYAIDFKRVEDAARDIEAVRKGGEAALPGPRPGQQPGHAIMWKIAESILTGPDSPARGRGWKKRVAELVEIRMRALGHSHKLTSIERDLRTDLQEWEKKHR